MWISTYHVFSKRAGFLAACDAAGWQMVQGALDLPEGVALEILGPILAPATIDEDGRPVAGEVIDAGYHVNLAWHARNVEPAFAASIVTPATPARAWGLPAPRAPSAPAVPPVIAAWKGKAVLREAGLLIAVETAVAADGGRLRDAWDGAATWERHGHFVTAMAAAMDLSDATVDGMFRSAEAIEG